MMNRIAVLGAGAWGTALSLLLAQNGHKVNLWVWDPSQASTMLASRENPFLPGFHLPSEVNITTSISDAVDGADAVVFVTISSAAVSVAEELRACLKPGIPVVSATKGLNSETGLTISQTLSRILPAENPIAAMSGPNLAVEVANGVPTATVAACANYAVAKQVQDLFMGPTLRVYTNSDVQGVELAGALKNVLAIGAGICDGLSFGDNTKAALLTRGLAEITRLGIKLGAKPATFMGLAGIGDIITTCASPLSRNRRVGFGLGQGKSLDDILKELVHVAEGVPTTRAAHNLATKLDIQMPITEEIYKVLFEGKSPQTAVCDLMTREPKEEVW
ncbi:MAG: NAD(P)H-dependent glycerol-3-phosphate dehydrogenase [Armatimonadota bacterium]